MGPRRILNKRHHPVFSLKAVKAVQQEPRTGQLTSPGLHTQQQACRPEQTLGEEEQLTQGGKVEQELRMESVQQFVALT